MVTGKIRGALFVLLFLALVALFSGSAHAAAINSIQIPALTALRNYIPALAGSWTDTAFQSTGTCGSWFGGISGITCDSQGRITAITLTGSLVESGPYPDLITNPLPWLTTLGLKGNSPLNPAPWSQLVNITTLEYDHTLYNGPLLNISTIRQFPNLQALQIINYYTPRFNGTLAGMASLKSFTLITSYLFKELPTDFFSGMTNLTTVRIQTQGGLNNLPSLADCTKLTIAYLSYNNISFIDDVFAPMTQLTTFEIAENPYLRKLPPSFASLTSLNSLNVERCQLNQVDSFPDLRNTAINNIQLSSNEIGDVFPTGLCQLSRRPYGSGNITFNALYNPITTLPACFADNEYLSTVYFRDAKFTQFPSVLAGMPYLRYLSITYTPTMTGALPDLSAMKKLVTLDLSYDGMTGNFPNQLKTVSSLRNLQLPGNSFTGTIDDDFFSNLTSFQIFNVEGNLLSGDFPASIGNTTSWLYSINGKKNSFTSLPSTLSQLTGLRTLDFSDNQLQTIPGDNVLSKMTGLQEFYIGGNKDLSGSLPTFWRNATNIINVNITYTGFTGGIPSIDTTSLQSVYLHDNALAGTFSPIIRGSGIRYLNAARNKLSGAIPSSIGTPTTGFINVLELDLSYNSLVGSIPASFSALRYLQKLRLQNNGIGGAMPNMGQMTSLSVINMINTNMDLCAFNPGIPSVSGMVCELYNVSYPGSCFCTGFYTRCITNTTCPPPDWYPIIPPVEPVPSGVPPVDPPVQVPVVPPVDGPVEPQELQVQQPETDSGTPSPTSAAPSSVVNHVALLGLLILVAFLF